MPVLIGRMLRVLSPYAPMVIASPTAALSLRGNRSLPCIGGLKAFLTRRQVNSSPGEAALTKQAFPCPPLPRRGLSGSDKAYTTVCPTT
jgi:hypothetical protein